MQGKAEVVLISQPGTFSGGNVFKLQLPQPFFVGKVFYVFHEAGTNSHTKICLVTEPTSPRCNIWGHPVSERAHSKPRQSLELFIEKKKGLNSALSEAPEREPLSSASRQTAQGSCGAGQIRLPHLQNPTETTS